MKNSNLKGLINSLVSEKSQQPQQPNDFQQPQPPNNFQQPQPTNNFQQPQPPNDFQQPQPPNNFQQPQPPNNFQQPQPPYNFQQPNIASQQQINQQPSSRPYEQNFREQAVGNPIILDMYSNNMHPSSSRPARPYDEKAYLKSVFDDMDYNRDGTIGPNELHEALRRGQPNSQFHPRTTHILMEKYDKNKNGKIQFDEFYDLFNGINIQYIEFLEADMDSSGFVDSRELENTFKRRGFTVSTDLVSFIASEISRRNNTNGINFDLYVRVIARFEYLMDQYNRMLPNTKPPVEQYIKNSFF